MKIRPVRIYTHSTLKKRFQNFKKRLVREMPVTMRGLTFNATAQTSNLGLVFLYIQMLRIRSVKDRFKGRGHRLLKKLCAWADQYQVIMTLYPCSMDPRLTDRQLTLWYKSYGFEDLPVPNLDDENLIRWPRSC